MRKVDEQLLDADSKVRLREISMTPEMVALSRPADPANPVPGGSVVQAAATSPAPAGSGPPAVGRSTASSGVELAAVGRARATDGGAGDLLDRHKQMQMILVQSMRQRGLDAQRDAADKARAHQFDDAVESLQRYLEELAESKIEPGQMQPLKRPVEARLAQYKLQKSQDELYSGIKNSKANGQARVDASRKAEEMKRQNVDRLMKDFNSLFKEGKYLEAENIAMKVVELDPDNGVALAAITMARRARAVDDYKNIKEGKEEYVLQVLNDAERPPPGEATHGSGVSYAKDVWGRAANRKPLSPITIDRMNEREKVIQRRLSTPVTVSFEGAPLSEVINHLRDVEGISIRLDQPALQAEGISLDSPISIKLEQVSLKSALNLILHQVHLTHVIKDEVLEITTEAQARGKLIATTYQVADLVIPVENFGDIRTPHPHLYSNLMTNNPYAAQAPSPVSRVGGGVSVGTPSGSSMDSSTGGSPSHNGGSGGGSGDGTEAARPTTPPRTKLIKLITSTISPRSWSEMGGPGTIDYFPLTMALVINQAADIQEQISDLLASLRRLQDQEVAVEVRLVSVTEEFFERIGVNFQMNIQTNNTKFQPSLLNNAFVTNANNFINTFQPNNALLGLTPAGSLTSDLNVPISTQSFFQTVPTYGGYTSGGLTLGLAFLSDIQVFLFMEAVQGDQRANIMQAPKLTLFNGQTATLNVQDQGSFVAGVQVVSLANGAQYSLVPQIQPTQIGVDLTIQAVISADRRLVRLSFSAESDEQSAGPDPDVPHRGADLHQHRRDGDGPAGGVHPVHPAADGDHGFGADHGRRAGRRDGADGRPEAAVGGEERVRPAHLQQDSVRRPAVQEHRLRSGDGKPADHGHAENHHPGRGRGASDRVHPAGQRGGDAVMQPAG